jgi:hypothetical protein
LHGKTGGADVEDYIVRIYRRKEENGGLFGVVEEVGIEGKKAFRSIGELVRLLRGDVPEDRPKAERTRVAIPVTVEGRDTSGEPFSENTVIEELSPRGAAPDRAPLLRTEKECKDRKGRMGGGATERGGGVPVSGRMGKT